MPEDSAAVGPNTWLVDEMYEQYLADPSSVSESWQEFFEDYRPSTGSSAAPPEPAPAAVVTANPSTTPAGSDAARLLAALVDLRDSGVISAAEYEERRNQLLQQQ